MQAGIDGAEDVATVELTRGKKIEGSSEEAHPGGPADGIEKKIDPGRRVSRT